VAAGLDKIIGFRKPFLLLAAKKPPQYIWKTKKRRNQRICQAIREACY